MDKNQVFIFDTTLRDGQQCPGAAMSFERCIEYARLAASYGINILEAGFPSASKLDFSIVKTIADEQASSDMTIAALCQLRDAQIDITIESLEPAVKRKKARLHVYLPVDPQLMIASLGTRASDKEGLLKDVYNFVKRAVDAGCEVEFSPEGYSRMGSNFDFATDAIRAALNAGASVINCPDTSGSGSTMQGKEYFVEKIATHAEMMKGEFPNRDIIWSVHCHNDFGLAVANSINGVFYGPARQIEGCINGVGERAGNAALEQCAMIIKHFSSCPGMKPLFTSIQTEHTQKISDFVARHMLSRQPHWPITGSNAFKHSSGGHTNAVLRDALVYQAFNPAETGSEITLLFGPLSGGNHAKAIIEKYGFACSDNEKAEIAQFVKDIYVDRRKGITDEELIEGYFEYRKPIRVTSFDYARRKDTSEVFLEGSFFGRSGSISGTSSGKDSALATLKSLVDSEFSGFQIYSYQSQSGGEGISALSISTIVVTNEAGDKFEGKGEDNDIEISAMKALIDAVNRAYIYLHYKRIS